MTASQPIGPLTTAAFPTDCDDGPPIVQEWVDHLGKNGGLAMLWAGAEVRRGGKDSFSWSWFAVHQNNEDTKDLSPWEQDDDAHAEDLAVKTERLLAPLAHAARIRIMLALKAGPIGATQLAEKSGLKGGNLYHHLRDLIHNNYVRDGKDRTYELTSFGRQMLLTLCRIAVSVVKDKQEDGLAITIRS